MDNEIIKIFKENKSRHAIIIVLFNGKKLPKYCTPMPRNPEPKINIPLNNNLSEIYFSALKENPSIKDGAILIQLDRNIPILRGFSYRLYPPSLKVSRLKNKGSGYNSAIDFSSVKRVICVYFINKNSVKKIINGREKVLFKLKNDKFDPELYRGTHEYYVNYRPLIPKEVIDIIVEHFDIKPTDRVLDIGCGTGQVALTMGGRCGEMVCLDPDPEMLKWGKKLTKNSKIKIRWINQPAENLGELRNKLGIFKLATFCRSFNWVDREQVLRDLDALIKEGGGVALFGDKSFWTGEERWQKVIKKVIQKYLGKERCAGKGKFKTSEEPWNKILARSVFRSVKIYEVPQVRNWDVESIIGCLFSTSFAAPHLFGNRLEQFKEEVKKTLLDLNPKRVFEEKAVWMITLGSKKPH